ncbi:MAG: hypothetical protein IJ074_09170 [Clostridia bacterium]|nr:hypothetical protein [Clostridia bacterium]
MYEKTALQIEESPFKNVYWFARYLLNTDEYDALGKTKERQLLDIVSQLENLLLISGLNDDERLTVAKEALYQGLIKIARPSTNVYIHARNLASTLDSEILSLNDVTVFCIAMRYVVVPINRALEFVPANDIEFCQSSARCILDTLGEAKVGLVIASWDKLGTRGCLDAERSVVIAEFSNLLSNVSQLNIAHTELDNNIIMTAFVQEFERRLGQKRKSRGGSSLESVLSFLFDYYGFKSSAAPSHFDQDLEVDKWFTCSDGWRIGISCKRTLRERWKQVSQADRGTLSHFKIKELWHLITYDNDLSDDKIVRLGEQGQIFYLMDDSPIYLRCSEHVGMKAYVRPLSRFIEHIRINTEKA